MPYKQGWETFVPLYFGSLAIGIICIVLAIFNAETQAEQLVVEDCLGAYNLQVANAPAIRYLQ